jgi:hypothetical protein
VVETNRSDSEQRLRTRIRKAFSKATNGKSHGTLKDVEDKVIALIQEYSSAPKGKREEVYEKGEKRILRAARVRRS